MPRKRRGKGEGSIYQRSDGRWVAEYDATLLDGGLKRKAIYGKTRKEVQEKLVVALRSEQQGIHMEPTRETLAQFLKRWLSASAESSVRPRTFESYRGHVEQHIIPSLGRHRLTQLTPPQVQQFYTGLMARGLSAKSVRNIHTTLHRALKEAVRWSLVPRNVADAVTPPRVAPYKGAVLDITQVRRLLGVAREERLYAALMVAAMTGLRQGELRALRWQDIDLDRAEMRVVASLYQRGHVWRIEETKTAKSNRSIPMDEDTVEALRSWRQRQRLERMAAGERWHEHGLVFTNTVGNPVHGGDMLMWLRVMLAKAGLPQMRWHDLRHTHATVLLANGEHPKLVQERLGHATISVTMDVYSHVLPNMQRGVTDRLGRLLKG